MVFNVGVECLHIFLLLKIFYSNSIFKSLIFTVDSKLQQSLQFIVVLKTIKPICKQNVMEKLMFYRHMNF